jgi:flavin-binding protein dodecin
LDRPPTGHPGDMHRGTRIAHIVGSSTRSVEEAIRDAMARAAEWGSIRTRITRISGRSRDGSTELYRVQVLVARPA